MIIDMNNLPKYDIAQTDRGWVISELSDDHYYHHNGLIFDSLEEAGEWLNGGDPACYVRIDWNLFPDPECFIPVFTVE